MIQRRTQTETYWREQFNLTSEDVSFVYDLILDEGAPLPTDVLSRALITRHCRKEEEVIQAELSKGPVYQPKGSFQVGEDVIFPALDYVMGTVVDTREGFNPEFGKFTVIQVQIAGEEDVREFASELQGKHKLNYEEGEADPLLDGELLSAAELYEDYGPAIDDKLQAALLGREEFRRFGEKWFLKDLLVPVLEGHLNIAEALIEIKGRPFTTTEFLDDLDMPAEVSREIQILSLNVALAADERFDNIGDSGRDLWYLRRLTPRTVIEPPVRLRLEDIAYDREDIDQELLLIEREIDDEGSGEEVMGASRPVYRTTISLAYPHWCEGTLPLTVRTRGLFPAATNHHTPIILVDGRSGDRIQGWVVHQESFVYGLGGWYKRHKLPVGAFIKLERTRDPRVVRIDFEARRLKQLWVVAATVQGGQLAFQMRKLAIACDYDDQMTISADDSEALKTLRAEVGGSGETLFRTLLRIMPALTKLSPQGTVHAKTICSVVNVLRRVAPGPIFALLSTEPCFVSMGGGYWSFDPALVRS